jgi:hypothetical protein
VYLQANLLLLIPVTSVPLPASQFSRLAFFLDDAGITPHGLLNGGTNVWKIGHPVREELPFLNQKLAR